MANPEHLQILKQGVEAWNQWREQNKGIRPDLRGANLGGSRRTGDDPVAVAGAASARVRAMSEQQLGWQVQLASPLRQV